MPIRHRSLRFGPLEITALAAFGIAAVAWATPRPPIRAEIGREERALALGGAVAAAEKAFLAKKALDANGDGMPEYGPLTALTTAGVLAHPLRSDAAGTFLEESGYRIEVLLPSAPLPRGGLTLARSTERVEPELSARAFAVVGLPKKGAGRRAFYLDAAGRLFVADGVCDDAGEPARAFPARALEGSEEDLKDGSTIWHLLSGPPEPTRPPRPKPK
jgi:hypothetical protein